MDKEVLCESLVTWLKTFSVEAPNSTIEDISDGVAMAQVLNQIAPDFFDQSWMSKIKTDAGNNWRLKVSNLKKILKGILDYYSDILGQHINNFHMPDVNAIGEHKDYSELGRLLQLILGCAVNCSHKQEYIQNIMAMEETVQHVVMNAIQELMTKESPAYNSGEGISTDLGDQLKRTIEELNTVVRQKEEIGQRCHELDLQVACLQEEKVSLQDENKKLQERANQSESMEDPSTPSGRRYQQLQSQVEKLQEEMYRIEVARDDYQVKVEVQEKEIVELQLKCDEMNIVTEEARALKDEVDVLKHHSDKVAKYEATIDTYKKKLEEMGDLRRQLKILEDKNTSYMQQNMELEEDVRKGGSWKAQVDIYKKQVQELQTKSSEETKRADKSEFENKRLQEKITSLQRERERLVAERDSLKETNEELTCTQLQGNRDSSEDLANLSMSPNMEMMSIPPEIRERLIRLQHENKMFKAQMTNSDTDNEDSQMLKSLLDDSNARKSELESENRIANQRILELEAQVEDMEEKQTTTSGDQSEVRKKLNEQIKKTKELDGELQRRRGESEELESRCVKSVEKATQLEDKLLKKEDEMKAMEERYKKYLEKAKSVIRTLDPKQNPGAAPEVQALRNQLQDKDRLIEHLERDHDRAKTIRDQEEKLIVSAWYNLGMQMHRKAAEDRLSNSGAGQSFLARQRQAQNRRLQTLPGANTSSSDYLEY
ncbi:protein Hook homolog 3-like [Lineus longissimus]|uniref:protein Hook homolog 3-like n=1 Tax=Lineus longissimus TaxID=88925 RepID=UPI002B4D21AA